MLILLSLSWAALCISIYYLIKKIDVLRENIEFINEKHLSYHDATYGNIKELKRKIDDFKKENHETKAILRFLDKRVDKLEQDTTFSQQIKNLLESMKLLHGRIKELESKHYEKI